MLFDALLLARIVSRDDPGITLAGMLRAVSQKIRRRCPHVFANEHAETAQDAARIWEREKRKEKEARSGGSI